MHVYTQIAIGGKPGDLECDGRAATLVLGFDVDRRPHRNDNLVVGESVVVTRLTGCPKHVTVETRKKAGNRRCQV
jgi:hypothetical protein